MTCPRAAEYVAKALGRCLGCGMFGMDASGSCFVCRRAVVPVDAHPGGRARGYPWWEHEGVDRSFAEVAGSV